MVSFYSVTKFTCFMNWSVSTLLFNPGYLCLFYKFSISPVMFNLVILYCEWSNCKFFFYFFGLQSFLHPLVLTVCVQWPTSLLHCSLNCQKYFNLCMYKKYWVVRVYKYYGFKNSFYTFVNKCFSRRVHVVSSSIIGLWPSLGLNEIILLFIC